LPVRPDSPAQDSAAAGIGRNTALNLAGSLVPLVVALATVPLYLDVIGQARYGVLTIAWLFLGYFGVFNLGLGRAAGNRIAKLRHAASAERERVFWTAFGLNLALGLVGAACLVLAGRALVEHVLNLGPDLRAETLDALLWLGLGVPFLTVFSVCVGSLEGLERFGVVNGLEIVTAAVYQVAPLVVAHRVGADLTWLIAAAATAPLVGALLAFGACARLLPLRSRPAIERTAVRPLFSFGGWVTVSGIVSPLLVALDRFVIGAISGPRAVTQYTVPLAVVSRVLLLPLSLARSLFPRLSFLPAGEARRLAEEATRALAAITAPLVVLGIVLIEPFLRVWVGDSLGEDAARVGELLLVGVWFNGLAFVPHTFLQASGRPDLPAKFHLLELAPYVAALWLGLSVGGIEGAAFVWSLRLAADTALLAAASRLYGRRVLMLAVPTVLVVVTAVGAAIAFDDPLARAGLGGALLALTLAWSWREAAERLRPLVPILRPTRPAR
jgi:O-antigen/teichoic acid export membrane protein